jgi:ribosome-associated toxin RatA of RatAB toxin-antitoxin module
MPIPASPPAALSRKLACRLALAAFALAAGAHAESALRSIDVKRTGDAYVIDAVIFAPVPPPLAWEVLTDFEHFARFAPNMRSSRVLKREGDRATIEQRGAARFGVASLPYVSERDIDLTPPHSIRMTQVKGSMKRLESLTTLAPEGSGTRIAYHIELVPSALSATVLSGEYLKHEIEEQFDAIVGEMVRRRS